MYIILLILITYSIIADVVISRTLHHSTSVEDFSERLLNPLATLIRNLDRVNIPVILVAVLFSDFISMFKSSYLDLIMFTCFLSYLGLEIFAHFKRLYEGRDDQSIVDAFRNATNSNTVDVPLAVYFRMAELFNFIGITLKCYICLIILKNL